MANGFYISKLLVTGLQQKTAKITFEPGFNVVSGPSNTGKSYIFACINFMLGGGESPKNIPESVGYNNVFLEIKTFSGTTYTLKRNISGGKFQVKEVEAENFDTKGIAKTLLDQHSPYDVNNISDFLLNISGFHNKEIKLNSNNAKRDLSYRDIANLSLIDESKIIVEKSPIYSSGQYNHQPSEQFILQLLLTGLDASALQEIEDIKVSKGKIQGKIEFIDKLIFDTREKISQLSTPDQQQKAINYTKRLDELSEVLVDASEQLELLQSQQQNLFNEVNKLESDELLNQELTSRFILLREQYDSDLNRLTFLIEGNSFLSQLVTVNCPLCGNHLDDNHKECLDNTVSADQSILEAIQIESQKIKLKKADLDSTIANNKIESKQRFELINDKKLQLNLITNTIKENLDPIKSASKAEIEVIIGQQAVLRELELSEQQIAKLSIVKAALVEELNSKPTRTNTYDSLAISKIQDLCDEIARILVNWNYSSTVSVTLNQQYKIYDFIINGVDRKSNGKGIRAVMYSAFVVALMQYCIKSNLPHPRNIILDSPLTTYHGVDSQQDNEDAPVNLQNSFFEDLAKLSNDRQIIIFDNKQPEATIIQQINFVRFTKNHNIGRYGFFQ